MTIFFKQNADIEGGAKACVRVSRADVCRSSVLPAILTYTRQTGSLGSPGLEARAEVTTLQKIKGQELVSPSLPSFRRGSFSVPCHKTEKF